MYKPLILSIALFLAPHSSQASLEKNFVYLPRLKCFLREAQFYTEIVFAKSDSHAELKGFQGELRNFVTALGGEKKLISGSGFKSVFYQNPGIISGIVGDAFGSSGSFTLTNTAQSPTGLWKYSHTDLSGATDEAIFRCLY